MAIAIPARLSALMASKYFWPLLFGTAYAGSTAFEEIGKAGERRVMKEQLKLEKLFGERKAETTKQLTEEARQRAADYTKLFIEEARRTKEEQRESTIMESLLQSQDRQAALLMQAIQAIAQTAPRYAATPSGGVLGLMRGSF